MNYPANDLDRPDKLLEQFGSLLVDLLSDTSLVSLAKAKLEIARATNQKLDELLASLSRFKLKPTRSEPWRRLVLKESELNQSVINPPLFDGVFTFQQDAEIRYGVKTAIDYFAWPLPPGIVSVPVVTNRLGDAAKTLIDGIDYFVRNEVIAFKTNPFNDTQFAINETETDRELSMWIYRPSFDHRDLYTQLGYVVGVHGRTGENYKRLLNAILDAGIEGTTQRNLIELLAAVTDASVAKDMELVRHSIDDGRNIWTVTDTNVYRSKSRAVVPAVGASVSAGQFVDDTVQIFWLKRGKTPTTEQLQALAISPNMLAFGYSGDLVFENKNCPVTVSTVNGYTKLEFPIGGKAEDVDQFWKEVHDRGVAANDTLAMRLDTRTNKVGQPNASNLPTTINPLRFLISNVLRNNVTVVKFEVDQFGPNAIGLYALATLRKLLPPGHAIIFVADLVIDADAITLDEGSTLYSETVMTFAGAELADTISADSITETVTATQIANLCE